MSCTVSLIPKKKGYNLQDKPTSHLETLQCSMDNTDAFDLKTQVVFR